MATKIRKPSLLDRNEMPVKSRAVGEQLIPLTDHFPARGDGRHFFFNRADYDSSYTNPNQLSLYDKFKLDTLAKQSASELQDVIASTGIVRAAMDAYISTCSTQMELLPEENEVAYDLYEMLFEDSNFKNAQDQIFEMIFLRGGAVVEMKFESSMNMHVPVELIVHDPKRFAFEEQEDERVEGGEKWALGLVNKDIFELKFEELENPAVQYIAWRPKAGEKPFGRSRVSASTYYAATLIQTIRLVTKILSKSGSPVLPITIDKEKLFGGHQDTTPFFSGDIDMYVRNRAAELQKIIPELGEGDALILTGECVLGEYLTPGSKLNIQGLEDWSDKLRLDCLWSMHTPPAVVGIVQKSASLDDNNTRFLTKNYKNNCHSDQMLVASALETIFSYGLSVNGIQTPEPVQIAFQFSNVEEQDEFMDIQLKRSETMKMAVEWISQAKESGILSEMEAKEQYEMELEAVEFH